MGKHSATSVSGELFISPSDHFSDYTVQGAIVQETLRLSPPGGSASGELGSDRIFSLAG